MDTGQNKQGTGVGNTLGMVPIIGQVAGGAINMAAEYGASEWQFDKNKRLMQEQVANQKQLMDYQEALQMDMWNKTNYKAQVEQLEKAGLNPALLYGQGGAGGQMGVSGGGAASGSVEKPNARTQLDILPAMMMKAQIDNLNADTKDKLANVPVKEAQVPNIQAQTGLTIQQTASEKFNTDIKNWQAGIEAVRATVATQTIQESIDQMKAQTTKLEGEARSAQANGEIDEKTATDRIQQAHNYTLQQGLVFAMTKAQTANITQNTAESKARENLYQKTASNLIQENMRDWDKMSQENLKITIQNELKRQAGERLDMDEMKAMTDGMIQVFKQFGNIHEFNKK